MRKTLTFIIIVFSITIYSCENDRITDLEKTVSELTELNSKLVDSIQILQDKDISSFFLIANLDKDHVEANKTSIVKVDFGYKNYVPKYDVYRLSGEDYEKRELILTDQILSEFKFEFEPKNVDDNRVKLEVVMNLDGIEYIIPADFQINVVD
ncbi:MAG: hypothetical protein CMC14_09270 [Flavobacteriaceae bacterium]|nr:hypothetical protein [Flavobacteriaceae bacterium]|tara:strand:+ start:531 stop:989 length:459 start_codon:yes stop_codon:yes gene_type:complete